MKKRIVFFVLIVMAIASLCGETLKIELRPYQGEQFVQNLSADNVKLRFKKKEMPILNFKRVNGTDMSGNNDYEGVRYVFIYHLRSFSDKVINGVNYFFNNIVKKGDSVAVFTPYKIYSLKSQVLEKSPKNRIASQLLKILERDIKFGCTRYNNLLSELFSRAQKFEDGDMNQMEGGIESYLQKYRSLQIEIESIRYDYQKKIITFLRKVGDMKGKNVVIYFYDREYLPSISPTRLQNLREDNLERPSFKQMLSSVFVFYRRNTHFSRKKISNDFSRANLIFNPIYFDQDPFIKKKLLRKKEYSEDIFQIFTTISEVTGGKSDNASNYLHALKKALKFSANYYRLEVNVTGKIKRKYFKFSYNDQHPETYFRIVTK